MMVDALEENVMKDILNIGLKQKENHHQPSTEIPTDEQNTDDFFQRMKVSAKVKIPQYVAAGDNFPSIDIDTY